MDANSDCADPDGYVVRPLEPDDAEGFVTLHNDVWSRRRSVDWFDWRFLRRPGSTDEPDGFVTEFDGELVGARLFFPYRARVGGEPTLLRYESQTMVREDHRRRGLLSRMTRLALDTYRDGETALTFNYPNEMSSPGYRRFGWNEIGEVTRSYRLQFPRAGSALSVLRVGSGEQLLGSVGSDVLGRVARVARRVGASPDRYRVTSHDRPPVDRLVGLYERAVPPAIHLERTAALYRWWFDRSSDDRRAYLVHERGTPVAGLLTRTECASYYGNEFRVTYLVDALPLSGSENAEPVRAGLETVVADHPNSSVFVALEPLVPPAAARATGFVPDSAIPPALDLGPERLRLMVRSLRADCRWTVNGVTIGDRRNWAPSGIPLMDRTVEPG